MNLIFLWIENKLIFPVFRNAQFWSYFHANLLPVNMNFRKLNWILVLSFLYTVMVVFSEICRIYAWTPYWTLCQWNAHAWVMVRTDTQFGGTPFGAYSIEWPRNLPDLHAILRVYIVYLVHCSSTRCQSSHPLGKLVLSVLRTTSCGLALCCLWTWTTVFPEVVFVCVASPAWMLLA
jgi:hypothetical protein